MLANAEFAKIRQRVASTLSGEVLEVGFGSGLNVPYYPPQVKRVQAVDPATLGRKLAERRITASPIPVEYLAFDGDALAVADRSVDHVLVTWTLCTIPDVTESLEEMYRVLRPGGQLHFVEHGLSPDPRVAHWQDRLNPLQGWWAGGCHLNRPIDKLVEGAGFDMNELENFYARGPRPMGYLYEGTATKA